MSLLLLMIAVLFLVEAICNVINHRWFQSRNSRLIPEHLRKKFRRAEAVIMFLTAAWALILYLIEEISIGKLALNLSSDGRLFDWVFFGGAILVILFTISVEFFYFKKLIREESV